MNFQAKEARVFRFSFCSALDDGTLYIVGVALELEDRDVPHSIIWERIDGSWNRYQWKNRSYGMVAFARGPNRTAIYMGYEGTLKVRSTINGSSEEVLDAGTNGPSSLRTVSTIRAIDNSLFVAGMRRMVYRRGIPAAAWSAFDTGLRQSRKETGLGGLYGFDGSSTNELFGVGIGGEVWSFDGNAWVSLPSPTNLTLLAIRHIGTQRYVVGGELGALWLLSNNAWHGIEHTYRDESFTCIESWQDRCFLSTESGLAFELALSGKLELTPFDVPGVDRISWISSTSERLWFVGGQTAMSFGADGWRGESPPPHLLAP